MLCPSSPKKKKAFPDSSKRYPDQQTRLMVIQPYRGDSKGSPFIIYGSGPTSDHATIQINLARSSHTLPLMCDLNGTQILTLLNDELSPGEHSIQLNTSEFSKGVYLVKMISDFGIVNGIPYGENEKLIVQ